MTRRVGLLWLRRLLVVALIGAALGVAFGAGLADQVSDQEELRRTIDEAGVWGPLLFLGLMVLLVPLNVPGLVFVIPSTTLFGTVAGILLSLAGGFAASAVGIVAARHLGRSTFAARIPPRVRAVEARLAARGFWAVVLLRMFTFLFQPVDWICGLSSMPMRTALGATLVGLVPPTVVVALAGGGILDLLF